MHPTRLRLSIDSDYNDSRSHSPNPNMNQTSNRVFIDAQGRPHDPDFLSHLFPEQTSTDAARRRAKRARRTSQTGLIADSDYSDDESDSEEDLHVDPFRNYSAGPSSTRRTSTQATSNTMNPSTIAKSSNYPATPAAYAQYQRRQNQRQNDYSPTSWQQQHNASLLLGGSSSDDGHEVLTGPSTLGDSPVSERWSVRRWSRRPAVDMDEEIEERTRRVLKKRGPADFVPEMNEDVPPQSATFGEEPEDEEDHVPSCAHALKSQWQALVLRVTLSAHRTKRRLRPKKEESYTEKNWLVGVGT